MIFINNRFKKVKPYTFLRYNTKNFVLHHFDYFIRAQNKYSIPKKTMRINKIRKYPRLFLFHNYKGILLQE